MGRALLLVTCALALAGCFSRTMVNQATGQRMKCEAFGWGLVGLPVAAVMYDQCVRNLEAQGYQ